MWLLIKKEPEYNHSGSFYLMEIHVEYQLIKEHLEFLIIKIQLFQSTMFEDLSNRNSNSHGTEVIISLPPPLYKIIVPL